MRIEKATMRSAEEVAREMVKRIDWERCNRLVKLDDGNGYVHIELASDAEIGDLEALLVRVIERTRAEGVAAERIRMRDAGVFVLEPDDAKRFEEMLDAPPSPTPALIKLMRQQPRDLANVGRATTCGTCLTALSEEPHRPGCPEPGYTAERQRVAALVRAARRWAAEARKTGRPAEEQIAADLDLVEAVEALDGAAAAQQPTETIAQQEARHRAALRCARAESHEASLYAELEQPCDLAARIRALVQEYAGLWADGARLPESRHLRVEACMHAMRWLWHTLRRMETDGAFPEDRIAELRKHKGDDIVAKTMRKVADDLERIVRECEMRG